MGVTMRFIARWGISLLVVAVPVAYLLWQWRYEEHKVLSELSYEAFNERFNTQPAPAFWTFGIWVILVYCIMVTTTGLVAWGLKRVFPEAQPAGGSSQSRK